MGRYPPATGDQPDLPGVLLFNITTYTADNAEASLATEQQVLNSYRKGGFQLIPARYHHLRNFLAMMPFKCGEGLFKELQAAGVVKRAETFQVANLPADRR